jgi:hypothetical protein
MLAIVHEPNHYETCCRCRAVAHLPACLASSPYPSRSFLSLSSTTVRVPLRRSRSPLEHKGKDGSIVRFTFDMIEGLKIVEEEEAPQ